MKAIKLTANNTTEQRILDFLNQNASETLTNRINAGQKTLAGAVRYAKKQAKELAERENRVCVEAAVVFGWVVHFFEEDSIPENETKPAYKAPAGCKPCRVENTPAKQAG